MKTRMQDGGAEAKTASPRRGAVRAVAGLFAVMAAGTLGGLPWPTQAQLQAQPQAASPGQGFPNRPVRLVVAFGPGSGSDIVARLLAEDLRAALGQQVIVDNKPGGSAQIAAEFVAKAPADGYTLLLTTNTAHSANPYLFKKLGYDPMRDFTPIARVAYVPYAIVVDPKSPIDSVRALVEYARANPGKLNYGFGNSTSQVAGAAFARQAGIELTAVGYKSMPPAYNDLIGGQVQVVFADMASAQVFMKSGRLKPLAFTLEKRSALMPELPTVAETPGFTGFEVTSWIGLVGPAGMPRDAVERLSTEMQRTLAKPEIRERLAGMGVEPAPSSPQEMDRFLRQQLESWRIKIRDAGIQPE